MTAEGCQDHLLFTGLFAFESLGNGGCKSVGGLGSGHDSLGSSKLNSSSKAVSLSDCLGLDQSELIDMADEWTHTVVSQATCMNGVGNEVVAKRVHLHEWSHACGIAEVIGVGASRERGASSRLNGTDCGIDPTCKLLSQEGKAQPSKVRSAAGTPNDQIWGIACFGHLQQGFFADHCLMHQHVIQH